MPLIIMTRYCIFKTFFEKVILCDGHGADRDLLCLCQSFARVLDDELPDRGKLTQTLDHAAYLIARGLKDAFPEIRLAVSHVIVGMVTRRDHERTENGAQKGGSWIQAVQINFHDRANAGGAGIPHGLIVMDGSVVMHIH